MYGKEHTHRIWRINNNCIILPFRHISKKFNRCKNHRSNIKKLHSDIGKNAAEVIVLVTKYKENKISLKVFWKWTYHPQHEAGHEGLQTRRTTLGRISYTPTNKQHKGVGLNQTEQVNS